MDLIGSLLIGCAAALVGWWFARAMTEVDAQDDEWRYDRVRIAELKKQAICRFVGGRCTAPYQQV